MPGYMFGHTEVYARTSRSQRRDFRTACQVLDEVSRVPGNTPHISRPAPPKVVDGCSLEQLRAAHNAVEAVTQTLKNGRTRKIRSTQNSLACAVLSYPILSPSMI